MDTATRVQDIATLHRLLVASASLLEILSAYAQNLEAVHQEIDAYRGRTCNGWATWTDRDHPTKAPKLVIVHKAAKYCPIHGRAERGQRGKAWQVYVGVERQRQEAALEAIEAERQLNEAHEKARDKARAAEEAVVLAAQHLGYYVDFDGICHARKDQ